MRTFILYTLLFITGCSGTDGIQTSYPVEIKERLYSYEQAVPDEYCFPTDEIIVKCNHNCGVCKWDDNDWNLICERKGQSFYTFHCAINCNECNKE